VTAADGTTVDATYVVDFGFMPLYQLPRAVDGPLTVALPEGTAVRSSTSDRSPQVSYDDSGSDPVASVYCRNADPHATSFDLLYPTGHPDLSSGVLVGAPFAVAIGAFVLAVGLTGRAAWIVIGDRRRPVTTDA